MDSFTDVFRAILRTMAAYSLNDAALKKRELVRRDELNWLNL
jgi:hypothetical protein